MFIDDTSSTPFYATTYCNDNNAALLAGNVPIHIWYGCLKLKSLLTRIWQHRMTTNKQLL